jgi:hypothetical protein
MANNKVEKHFLKLIAIDGIKQQKELTSIITKICDIIAAEDMSIEVKIRELKTHDDSLEKMAGLMDLEIRAKVINKIRKSVLAVIKTSTDKMILSTIRPGEN